MNGRSLLFPSYEEWFPVVQASQPKPEYQTNPQQNQIGFDPNVLRAARRIYHAYLKVHAQRMRRPQGVAINPQNCRGILLFSAHPVLLPGESFVPFETIETDLF